MLIENTMFGDVDKVKKSIDRLKSFEPEEGYYLCFSGGKDSQYIYHLAKESGVKFDAHYNITGIDPPELVYFIRKNYPDVKRHMYKESMFRLIEKRGLPTRLKRFCCEVLKEHGGEGRICVTGVRWAESNNRAKNRNALEIFTQKKTDKLLFNDNDEGRKLFENCMQKGKRIINPIIDWEDGDVWEYLNSRNIEYCKLYDEGYSRLGCIGCNMSNNRAKELERYPKFKENYKRAIQRFLAKYLERCQIKGKKPYKETVEEWFQWWMEQDTETSTNSTEGQIDIMEYCDDEPYRGY